MTDALISDIIVTIASYLNDWNKLQFLSTTNYLHSLKNKVYYNDIINLDNKRTILYESYQDLWYFDQFTNIMINNFTHKLPKSITYLKFNMTFNQCIKDHIPNTVTHLMFGLQFDQNIEGCIPNSITHLTFGFVLIKISKIVFLIQLLI